MDLIKSLEAMMLVGSEWILYLLMALSVVTIAIALERFFYLRRNRIEFKQFCVWFSDAMIKNKVTEIESKCSGKAEFEYKLVGEGLKFFASGSSSLDHRLKLVMHNAKQDMDKGILFLGTVGSNAPFIGLLGTVFGVIEAFHQLAATGAGGSSAVMAGISEALVATAVGLIVAIPAVVLFNFFQRSIKTRMANLDALRELILSFSDAPKQSSKAA